MKNFPIKERTMSKRMTIVESLRAGAELPGCANPKSLIEGADTIERLQSFIPAIEHQLYKLEKRVAKLEK